MYVHTICIGANVRTGVNTPGGGRIKRHTQLSLSLSLSLLVGDSIHRFDTDRHTDRQTDIQTELERSKLMLCLSLDSSDSSSS